MCALSFNSGAMHCILMHYVRCKPESSADKCNQKLLISNKSAHYLLNKLEPQRAYQHFVKKLIFIV